MNKKIFSVLTVLSLFFSFHLNSYDCNAVSSDDSSTDIMCIGDSITDGYGIAGSYRKFLYHYLTENGYSVDMIGSKEGWNTTYTDESTGYSFDYDDGNSGYSGYSVKSYNGRIGIYETLRETNCLEQNPDIVILQIGTNNIIDNHDETENINDLSELIDFILDNIPADSVLFVTTIPNLDPNRSDVYQWFSNYRHSADWQTQYDDEVAEANVHSALNAYNSDLKDLISQKCNPRLFFADINSVITDVKTQLADGVHPNNVGYELMGRYWADLISSFLENSDIPETSVSDNNDTPEHIYSVADLVTLCRFLLNEETGLNSDDASYLDVNDDNCIDIFDLAILRNIITQSDVS